MGQWGTVVYHCASLGLLSLHVNFSMRTAWRCSDTTTGSGPEKREGGMTWDVQLDYLRCARRTPPQPPQGRSQLDVQQLHLDLHQLLLDVQQLHLEPLQLLLDVQQLHLNLHQLLLDVHNILTLNNVDFVKHFSISYWLLLNWQYKTFSIIIYLVKK